MGRNPVALIWGYTDRAVELCYLRFHFIDEYCFEVAPITLTLPVRADKVWVHNPTLVLSVLDNEAAAALTTTHCGLKVVMMNPPTLTVGLGGAESQGELAADGSVVYGGDTTTSQTVQVMREGFRIHNVMKSAEASTEFTHNKSPLTR